ncbi:MAG: hypothetical protein ABMA25_05315 [Ilumatobacteraceae bacterium]
MSTASPLHRVFQAGADQPVPADLTGVRWPDGTVECRFRLTHPGGSLSAADGEVGVVLVEPNVECSTCSDACGG